MHDNTLTNPPNLCHEATYRKATKPIDPRCNLNRPPPTSNPLDILDPRTDDAQDAPPHCFDFRQFRHVVFTTEDTDSTVEEPLIDTNTR